MTVFIAIAALMTLLVVVWVLRPLLRSAPAQGVSSERLNVSIYRDQLKALETDFARGAISPTDFEANQDELQLRLLDDTAAPIPTPDASTTRYFWTARRTAVLVALLFPLGVVGMYGWLGAPHAIDPVASQQDNLEKINQMVGILADRLKTNPDNPTGWAMLARSYKVMGRVEDAEQAFSKIGPTINSNPDLLVEYADLLVLRANGNIEGQPLVLVNKALALNPQHPMGLMISGIAAYRRADFKTAIQQWESLLAQLEPGSPDAQQVEADIADARTKTGQGSNTGKLPPVNANAAGPMTAEKINQMVERLAAKLKANPTDLEGWARLALAYKVQGRLAESEQAYIKAGKLSDARQVALELEKARAKARQ